MKKKLKTNIEWKQKWNDIFWVIMAFLSLYAIGLCQELAFTRRKQNKGTDRKMSRLS